MIEYLELTIKNLTFRKMRTFLTLLGIIIGITAIVALVSIGEGMTKAVNDQFDKIGADKIFVASMMSGGGGTGQSLTDADVRLVERIPGVKFVTPIYTLVAGSEFKGEEKALPITGVPAKAAEQTFSDARAFRLMEGRWISQGDRKKATIGFKVHDDFYRVKVNVGDKILIQGNEVEVVGIFADTGDNDMNQRAFMDFDYLREIMGKGDEITEMVVRVDDISQAEAVSIRIKEALEKNHDTQSFVVLTSQELVKQITDSFKVIQVVFGGIAAVSLIVGGVGIANTMIMNVLERTKEIGIMKATGAKSIHVLRMIVVESGIIGIIGGGIGVLMGYVISLGINRAAEQYLGPNVLTTAVTMELALFALTFSFVVGIISGVYPAYRAAKLDPVVALRS
ncbi:MAG: ABC transporter permease [Methanobacteriota archaeon]|nr:MAG: ABC transporter permease [Euryarchaeota archaeon]